MLAAALRMCEYFLCFCSFSKSAKRKCQSKLPSESAKQQCPAKVQTKSGKRKRKQRHQAKVPSKSLKQQRRTKVPTPTAISKNMWGPSGVTGVLLSQPVVHGHAKPIILIFGWDVNDRRRASQIDADADPLFVAQLLHRLGSYIM